MYAFANNCFYPLSMQEVYEDAGSWPTDFIEVDEAVFAKYSSTPPDGKMRGTGNDGLPTWVNTPQISPEELIKFNEQKKQQLRSEADFFITPLKDALDESYIDDADQPKLIAWQKYRYALTKVDPANPVWPEKPE